MAKSTKPPPGSRARGVEQKAEAIAACRDATGRVTPKAVVAAARDPASVLHDDFEWDVNVASQKEWERTAAELIRQVRFIVKLEDRQIAVPYYVSDPRDHESSYVATPKAAKNASLSQRILREELDRITSGIRRAMNLAAAFGLRSSFERMLAEATEIEAGIGGDYEGDSASA